MGRAFELRKGRKMKRWSAMAKTFTRIGKDIVMAIKDGSMFQQAQRNRQVTHMHTVLIHAHPFCK